MSYGLSTLHTAVSAESLEPLTTLDTEGVTDRMRQCVEALEKFREIRDELREARSNGFRSAEYERKELARRAIDAISELHEAIAFDSTFAGPRVHADIGEVFFNGQLAKFGPNYHSLDEKDVEIFSTSVDTYFRQRAEFLLSIAPTGTWPIFDTAPLEAIVMLTSSLNSSFIRSCLSGKLPCGAPIDSDQVFTVDSPVSRIFHTRDLRSTLADIHPSRSAGPLMEFVSGLCRNEDLAKDLEELSRHTRMLDLLGFTETSGGFMFRASTTVDFVQLEELGPPEGVDGRFWSHKLRELPSLLARRRKIVAEYHEALAEGGGVLKQHKADRQEIEGHIKAQGRVLSDLVLSSASKLGLTTDSRDRFLTPEELVDRYDTEGFLEQFALDDAEQPAQAIELHRLGSEILPLARAIGYILSGLSNDPKLLEEELALHRGRFLGLAQRRDIPILEGIEGEATQAPRFPSLEDVTEAFTAYQNVAMAMQVQPVAQRYLDSAIRAINERIGHDVHRTDSPHIWKLLTAIIKELCESNVFRSFSSFLAEERLVLDDPQKLSKEPTDTVFFDGLCTYPQGREKRRDRSIPTRVSVFGCIKF